MATLAHHDAIFGPCQVYSKMLRERETAHRMEIHMQIANFVDGFCERNFNLWRFFPLCLAARDDYIARSITKTVNYDLCRPGDAYDQKYQIT